jgi:hypothetical protein
MSNHFSHNTKHTHQDTPNISGFGEYRARFSGFLLPTQLWKTASPHFTFTFDHHRSLFHFHFHFHFHFFLQAAAGQGLSYTFQDPGSGYGEQQVMKTPVLNIGVSAVAGVVGSAYSVTSRLSTMAYDTSSRIVDVSKNTLTDITLLPVGVATDSINLISPSKKATAVKTAPRCQFSSVLFPSGTDAEYLPLLLALNRSCLLAEELYREKRVAPDDPNKVINPKVINIVVAAGEVGSGTAPACQGLHFSPQAPMGFAQKNAQPVFNCSSSSLSSTKMSSFDSKCAISVINHKLRLNISNPELDEINFFGSIRSLVAKEPAHAVIVLHVVVCSKTGLVYPSIAHVNELRRDYGNRVIVVVDACQFRVKLELISMYLNSNFIVLITGSKFFAGPPFRLACLQMV